MGLLDDFFIHYGYFILFIYTFLLFYLISLGSLKKSNVITNNQDLKCLGCTLAFACIVFLFTDPIIFRWYINFLVLITWAVSFRQGMSAYRPLKTTRNTIYGIFLALSLIARSSYAIFLLSIGSQGSEGGIFTLLLDTFIFILSLFSLKSFANEAASPFMERGEGVPIIIAAMTALWTIIAFYLLPIVSPAISIIFGLGVILGFAHVHHENTGRRTKYLLFIIIAAIFSIIPVIWWIINEIIYFIPYLKFQW